MYNTPASCFLAFSFSDRRGTGHIEVPIWTSSRGLGSIQHELPGRVAMGYSQDHVGPRVAALEADVSSSSYQGVDQTQPWDTEAAK